MKIENMLQRFNCISFSFKPPYIKYCRTNIALYFIVFILYVKKTQTFKKLSNFFILLPILVSSFYSDRYGLDTIWKGKPLAESQKCCSKFCHLLIFCAKCYTR